tara:strand:+ start:1492 stop:1695 length:204 start_codon:yes stop_codon:yes gene_type:complete
MAFAAIINLRIIQDLETEKLQIVQIWRVVAGLRNLNSNNIFQDLMDLYVKDVDSLTKDKLFEDKSTP